MTTGDIFKERITELRKERGLKRQQAADDLGITRASLEFYEKGKRKPDIEMTARIAEYYNVSADYLLGLSEGKTINDDLQAICKYTGLSDTVVNNYFHNTKDRQPYNLAYILNSICADKENNSAFCFLVSHIVELKNAAEHYNDLEKIKEQTIDDQLFESIVLQADERKDIVDVKQFRVEKEFRTIIERFAEIGV